MTPSDSTFSQKNLIINGEYIFSTICYYERLQAPIVHRVHLVLFSTSFQWKSINLLFHIIQTGNYCIFSLLFRGSYSVGSQQCLKLRKVHTCQFINQLRKRYLLVILIWLYWKSGTEFLTAKFFDTFDTQCIFDFTIV